MVQEICCSRFKSNHVPSIHGETKNVLNFSAMPKTTANTPVIIDLFAGAGGLSLGAARAGFIVKAAVEIDPQAFEVHSFNFPTTIHSQRDIFELTGQELLTIADLKPGELDGLIGGPPCQGFSMIGKRDANDQRNGLFAKFFQLVKETQPKFYLAENVPNILSDDFTQIIENALSIVKDDYISLPVLKVNASEYGAPTSRTRIFFLGIRRNLNWELSCESFKPAKNTKQIRVKTALKGLPETIDPTWQTEEEGLQIIGVPPEGKYRSRITGCIPQGVGNPEAIRKYKTEKLVYGSLGTKHSAKLTERFAPLGFGKQDKISKCVRLNPEGFCPTLRAGTGSDKGSHQAVRPIHPTQPRVITPREAARLQGFPDWFVFHRTKWHSFRQIGNSVSPIVSESILKVFFNGISQ